MQVIFVSQCEKKAIKRTQQVLDAFANRVGDKTWQTTITEDGLITVKSLLRKTATKNTAIACHWIRSRSRSDMVWIVGNRERFNAEGIVSVNSTAKEVPMDILTNKPKDNELYANTQLQLLAEHLFAVGFVAEQLHKQLMPEKHIFSTAVFIAGCLHDIGKIDPCFQEWVRNPKKRNFITEDGQHIDDKKFNFDKHPRHNEISVMFYQLFDDINLKHINTENKKSIKHAIYWHHAKPFPREKDFRTGNDIRLKLINNLKNISFENLLEKATHLIKKIGILDTKYRNIDLSEIANVVKEKIDHDRIGQLDEWLLPEYKLYDCQENIREYESCLCKNANNNIIRSCVITADRLISALSPLDLYEHIQKNLLENLVTEQLLIESSLCSNIDNCLNGFPKNERSKKQEEVAKRLSELQNIAVLAGPAGCGKTKIALEWAKLKRAHQIIWICPRVQICQGLFYDLTSEQYLPNANIEINTGEFKFLSKWDNLTNEDEYFSGDIVITTVDQIFSSIISHNKANLLINFLNTHIVFDEFHEYVNMPAFNLLFAELIRCKQQQLNKANTLLVSATPHYFYLNEVLKIDFQDIIEMPSFNQNQYRLEFNEFNEVAQDASNPFYKLQQPNTMVISNTALTAQKSFIYNQHNENAVLLHSKFKKSDKRRWFTEVYESFKKDGTNKFAILRSGPIVQAALNITCGYMVSEMTSAENMLQRLGRLDRFGDNSNGVNVLTVAITTDVKNGKSKGNSSRFLNNMNLLQSAKAWYEFISVKLADQPIVLSKLYNLYREFHGLDNCRSYLQSDLITSLKKSVQLINNKIIDPITVSHKKSKQNNQVKISKNSLRGENRFVQMAVCDVSTLDHSPKFINQYAYQQPINEREDFDNLTASRDEIEGYGDSNKNLLSHMMKKHHNIMGGTKAYKDFILFNEARDPEFPIYLSYTPNDLLRVGGESARHPYAIYYAICDKQPIGAIPIQQLKLKEE